MNIVSLLNVSFLHLENTRKSCECDIDNIPGRVVNVTLTIFSCVMFLVVLHTHTPVCVITTGFQARSRGGRWSWTLKLAQKRSGAGRWSWAAKVGLLSLRVVPQQQCNGHCLCDSAQARQLKQQLRSAQVAGQWRGDTASTLPLFWRRSTVSPVFFGRYPRSSLHSFAHRRAFSVKACPVG